MDKHELVLHPLELVLGHPFTPAERDLLKRIGEALDKLWEALKETARMISEWLLSLSNLNS